ncbi:unnamed protein product [Caenorhabditis angaria]|uniref:Uncharacterized protein n=1 Tax=Caenorhabditis angaria TaxID=860376 RepID=A0A9P1J688_9PELO|nr:unnamed protein product [Caenorhabditis angaria]
MFNWTRQRSRSRNQNVIEFSDEEKAKFETAKKSHISTKCPIPIEQYMKTVSRFSKTCGVFCFEKAFSFISDYKAAHFGPPISPSNPYILILNILEQLANCDRKYYILSYLEQNDVTKTKPLRLSYASLLKSTNILHKGFLEIKFWVIVRLLREIQGYIKARICAINLYKYMAFVANDCDIEWKEITERGHSIIEFLLHDCQKSTTNNDDYWDTDSDVEHLNSTLEFLPIQEVIFDEENDLNERREKRQEEKRRLQLLNILEKQKQSFLTETRKQSAKSDKNKERKKLEPRRKKPPIFTIGGSSGSSSGSGSTIRSYSSNESVNSEEQKKPIKKSSMKSVSSVGSASRVTFSSASSSSSISSFYDSQSSESTSSDCESSISTENNKTPQNNVEKKERISDEKHPKIHLKNSYIHRVIDSFEKNEDLSKLSLAELQEKFEIDLDLMSCEKEKFEIPKRKKQMSKTEKSMREEAEIEREEVIWFKESIEKKIRLIDREASKKSISWWKKLGEDIETLGKIKTMPDNSAEECAARFLRQEKYLGFEGVSKNIADDASLSTFYRNENEKSKMKIEMKKRILEQRKSASGNKKQKTENDLENEKVKVNDTKEGACYIESSDDEDSENEKKSYVLQNMRKLFSHEIYTLMLIFETQYNMAAGNMVRCVGYMNQLSFQFEFLSSELEAIEHQPEKFFSFKKEALKPRNNLIHWFMHVYQLLQAKLCLYATDVFGPSCLTLKDYTNIQKIDNGFNFVERCVEFTQISQAFFLCICVGGRQRISEKDGNFESCMVLPEYGKTTYDVEMQYEKLLEEEKSNQAAELRKITRKRVIKPMRALIKIHDLGEIYDLPLVEARKIIEDCSRLSYVEKEFLRNNLQYLQSRESRDKGEPAEPQSKIEKENLVPIIFRIPSPLNSEHNGIAMVKSENSNHAFQLTSVFVQQHLHPKCLLYNEENSIDRKPYRFVHYDSDTNKTYFGESIERDLYMVIIFSGRVRKWERHIIDFLNDILPEIRCSNSLKLLSHAANNPELGGRGRVGKTEQK